MTIESRTRHDFVSCDCGNIFVDGGKAYLRRGFKQIEKFEDLSVVEFAGPTVEDQKDEFTTSDMFTEAS